MPRTRFAPSPTGYLHLGHAYAALFAHKAAKGSDFLLRIEDIDVTRCKVQYTEAIFEDLAWLGLKWPQPVRIQSLHNGEYMAALDSLRNMGLLYPCFCTRKQVVDEVQRAAAAPHRADGKVLYAGTCRHLAADEREERLATRREVNWRLDVARASAMVGPLQWRDIDKGMVDMVPHILGDVVLARKDIGVSYHLCVTVDDDLQKIERVTRGEDLFESTHIHRLLQELLSYSVPDYHHHVLIGDAKGQRYAKRTSAVSLRDLRQQGWTKDDVYRHVYRKR